VTDGYSSALARELAPDILERFLRYVRIHTTSDEALAATRTPSTERQLDLSRLLVEELHSLGLGDAALDEHGHVVATLPATVTADVPVIGLLAHVDTSPEVSGEGVDPQVHRGYDGGAIVLPGAPERVLDPTTSPDLAACIGHDVVTSDGTTLLGADDKAGVAEIMAATRHLLAHPEIPHGVVRLAFTVDEETGLGIRSFDVERFGAAVAYTLDGSSFGELEDETFNGAAARVTIVGHSEHPGTAKGRLVSALKLAAQLVASLPADRLSPETTEDREGFVHPTWLHAGTETATVDFILRDHDADELAAHEAVLRGLVDDLAAAEPRASISVEVRESYRNMKPFIDADPRIVAHAEEAMRRAGVPVRRTIIRGGTDGSQLSARGLPTPNLFTGGHDYHSVREWASLQEMSAAAATIVHLVQVWAEDGAGG
jgi:tripeptide aminopeptidase